MSNKGPVVTRKLYYVVAIVTLIIVVLFFTSLKAYLIWPIGAILELLLLGSVQIGTFHANSLVVERPFLFQKRIIDYRNVLKFRINPAILTTPPMVLYYIKCIGNVVKSACLIYMNHAAIIREIIRDGNPDAREKEAFGESLN